MIPAWPAVVAAFLVAAVFFTAIGLPLARAAAPAGMPALAMAPALGWAVFNNLALPLLSVIGFSRVAIVLYGLAAAAGAAWLANRLPRQSAPPLPRWTLAVAAILAALPAMAVMPKFASGGILLGPPIFDHVKIAIVDAILRSGLPVPNPFYGPHGAGHLAYYYLWHFAAAVLARGLGVGGWAAEAAMTGFTGYAALLLVMGAVVAVGGKARAVLAAAALLLAGSARPVLSALLGGAGAAGLIPRNADLGGWLNQAAWVPQHLASACSLILAALLMLRLATKGLTTQGGLLVAAILGVVAAASFETSVWIGGVAFAVTACLVGAMLLTQAPAAERVAYVVRMLAAAAVTALLVWPFILADLEIVLLRHAGAAMAVQPYPALGTWIPAAWRAPLDLPAFWIILLPFALPAILPLAAAALWRFRRPAGDNTQRRLARLFWMTAASCLGVAWLVRSTIDNNDLGWRAVLPAILVLSALAANELVLLAAECRIIATATALAVAMLAVPDTWRMVREYAAGQLPGDPQGFATSQPLWQALRRQTGPLDRVANDPLFVGAATPWPVNIAWATLSDRPSCFAGWETMIAYGPLATPQLIEVNDLFTRVFDGNPAPGDIHRLATSLDCAAAAVSRGDGAWARDPFATSPDYKLLEWSGDFRIYVRVRTSKTGLHKMDVQGN